MTVCLFKQIGRLWATIFVVYALLLANLLPVTAAIQAGDGGAVICSVDGAGDPTTPLGTVGHQTMCCVLCQIAALPARPVADALMPPSFHEVAGTIVVEPAASGSRSPPGTAPQSPRGPPIPS